MGLTLADERRDEDAIACYRKAIALKPTLLLAQYNLGVALKSQGRADEAAACFEQVLRLDPDNELAKFSLAALTAQNPARPPDKYIANLFDHHAPQFDAHLVDTLRYRVPQDLVGLARQHARPRDRKWDVLDLGCGTGLVGAAIAPFARAMVGVDLSPRMLGMARARNLYRRLEQGHLVAMMKLEPAASYDVIVAADVFIYVGDLNEAVREASRLLRADGMLCVSVEALVAADADAAGSEEENGYRLQVQRPLCAFRGIPAHARAQVRLWRCASVAHRDSPREGQPRARLAGDTGQVKSRGAGGRGGAIRHASGISSYRSGSRPPVFSSPRASDRRNAMLSKFPRAA